MLLCLIEALCKIFNFIYSLLCTSCLVSCSKCNIVDCFHHHIGIILCLISDGGNISRNTYYCLWFAVNIAYKLWHLLAHIIEAVLKLSEFIFSLYLNALCKITFRNLLKRKFYFLYFSCHAYRNNKCNYNSDNAAEYCRTADFACYSLYACIVFIFTDNTNECPSCNLIGKHWYVPALSIYLLNKACVLCCKSFFPEIKTAYISTCYGILLISYDNLSVFVGYNNITCTQKAYILYIALKCWESDIQTDYTIVLTVNLYFLSDCYNLFTCLWIRIWTCEGCKYTCSFFTVLAVFIPLLVRIVNFFLVCLDSFNFTVNSLKMSFHVIAVSCWIIAAYRTIDNLQRCDKCILNSCYIIFKYTCIFKMFYFILSSHKIYRLAHCPHVCLKAL